MRRIFTRWIRFFQVKRLELELWRGEKFQRYCNRIKCHYLAELERTHNMALKHRIDRITRELEESARRK